MKTPRTPRHNTGEEAGLAIDGRPVPYLSGVLPKDFAKRIARLKKASGLTWSAFADALGVDKKSLSRWSNGTEPCGGAYHSLMSLAPMFSASTGRASREAWTSSWATATRCTSGRTGRTGRTGRSETPCHASARITGASATTSTPTTSPRPWRTSREASGLSWAEIARRLGTSVMTLWRWRYDGIRPNFRNLLAFQELAKSMGLGHLLPTIEVRYVPVRTGRPFPG